MRKLEIIDNPTPPSLESFPEVKINLAKIKQWGTYIRKKPIVLKEPKYAMPENNKVICKDCGQPMFEIGGIGKTEQLGEYRKQENSEMSIWHATGMREQKLYQCPEDKTIALD